MNEALERQDALDPVFDSLCFLALQKQFEDTSGEAVRPEEVEQLNKALLAKLKTASSSSNPKLRSKGVVARFQELLGTQVALGLYRKPRGSDVPKELEAEIERAIDEDADSESPRDED